MPVTLHDESKDMVFREVKVALLEYQPCRVPA